MSESDVDDSHIYNVAQLTFKKGQKYLIQAHSGRGKTSFLNLIYGMNQNYHGEIIYHPKQEATDFQQIRKKSLSYVFQELQLFEELTAFENIEIKNRLIKYLPTNDINAMLEKAGLIE